MITVKFTSLLRRELGKEGDSVAALKISDLLQELERRYGDKFSGYMSYCHIFVNGASTVDMKGRETSLADGDEVLFLLPVTGG